MRELKKVLVVDDEPTILLSLSHCLRSQGVEVIKCRSYEIAVEALSRYFFDLVIADLRLGGNRSQGGLEILDIVKKISPETAVIIMTAYGSEEVKKEAYQRGAFHYFDKPLNLENLISLLQELGIGPSASEKGISEFIR